MLIWFSTTLLAKQSSWYHRTDLDLGRSVWRSCIAQLWEVTWVFVSCSILWYRAFGGLLCIQLLVLLLLVVPPLSTSRIPLNVQSLPILSYYFLSWSLDLIAKLPLPHCYNAIFTCMNCLTKLCRLTPCFMGGS